MSVIFHKQLASIMEVLTSAAVTEISKVFDDGYAVLHLEMSRFVKENEALKSKLRTMERRVPRGCPERADARKGSAISRRFCEQVSHDARGTGEGCFQAVGRWSVGRPHTGGWTSPVPDDNALEQAAVSPGQCADREDERIESLLIKVEDLEDDRDVQGQITTWEEEGALERRAGRREKRSVEETQKKAANHTEELTEQHRNRRAVWEISGLESVLKAEGQSECVETLQHRGAEHRLGGLNSADSEFVMFERPGQLGSYCTQGGAVSGTEDPCCSYTTETDTESLDFHSKLQFTPPKDDDSFRDVGADSVSIKPEADGQPGWLRGPESEPIRTERRHGSAERERQAPLALRVLPPRPAHNAATVMGTAATAANPDEADGAPPYERRCAASEGFRGHRKPGARKRKFVCRYCGKGFPRAKELEIHQRVHTGERPFGCPHCGRRFTQKCNLKTHMSVHTGEKPFRCALCGKSFVQSGYLRAHQRVHTGEKPFSCAKCGKRFGQSSYLRSHQSVHTGEKPFRCARCGKSFTRSCHLKKHQAAHAPGDCAGVDLF